MRKYPNTPAEYSRPEVCETKILMEKGFCFSDGEGTATHDSFDDFQSVNNDFM